MRSFTSRLPSTWVATSTEVSVYPAWHRPQSGFAVCGAGGGAPWQVPHASCVPSTVVHEGVLFEPPWPTEPPWQ